MAEVGVVVPAKRTKLPPSVRFLIAVTAIVLEVWSYSNVPSAAYIGLAFWVFLAVLLVRYWIGVHRQKRSP